MIVRIINKLVESRDKRKARVEKEGNEGLIKGDCISNTSSYAPA